MALRIDRALGPPLCAALLFAKKLLRRRLKTAPAPLDVKRVLLLKMWGMGSLVLASALFEEIAATYPNAKIDVLTLRENIPILAFYPQVDRRITLDLSKGILSFLFKTLGTLFQLRREHYDILLDLEFFTRYSAIFSAMAGATRTHGFSAKGKWRGLLHDVRVPFNSYNHVSANFLTLLRGTSMEPSPSEVVARATTLPRIAAPNEAWERVAGVLGTDPAWRSSRPLVCVNPNAGDMALERRWPAEQIGVVLRALAQEDLTIVLTGSPGEKDYVAEVASRSGVADHLVNAAGRITIEELVALFSHADAVLTNDSGPLHIASAAGASTVALFGPETPILYGPLLSREGQRHIVHYRKLACSPCMFVHDNKDLSCWFAEAQCMTGITPADVLQSVKSLLSRRSLPVLAR